MKVQDAIYQRKSTRRFTKSEIEGNIIEEIIAAGTQAPSPKNDQPWKFLVIKSIEKKKKIADILENQLNRIKSKYIRQGKYREDIIGAFETVRIIKEAPTLIFVYLDFQKCKGHDDGVRWELNAKDIECTHIMAIGAAIQNMLLIATEKGINSLWMADIFYAYNELQTYLGEEGCMMAAIALGYGMDIGEKVSRRGLKEVIKYI